MTNPSVKIIRHYESHQSKFRQWKIQPIQNPNKQKHHSMLRQTKVPPVDPPKVVVYIG